tara:strand:- start:985 stop:2211 length:1227 start_codon:yes stop_codon:yes gene_type:complete
MIKLSNNFFIFSILTLGTVVRLISIYVYGDTTIDKEWGIMLYNLEVNNILSVRSVDGVPVPNIFMPPLYPIFLYLIKLIFQSSEIFLNATLIIQVMLSISSIILAYKILLNFFSKELTLLGTFTYSFFPLNVYAVSQISSITLQMFLINIFLYFFIKIFKEMRLIDCVFYSLASALLILLRGEFFVFVFLSLIYLLLYNYKNLLRTFGILVLIILIISPYLYRNYNIFGVITLTKSSGYNLLKGNHPDTTVEGIGMFGDVGLIVPAVKKEMDDLKKKGPIKNHDLIKDEILMKQATKFIKQDPIKYFNLYWQKFFSFIFFDMKSTYPKYYSPLHIYPKIILSITTLIGILSILSLKLNLPNYFSLFYIANIALFSIFFILPRYSLSLLTIQIILSLFGIEKILKKIKN